MTAPRSATAVLAGAVGLGAAWVAAPTPAAARPVARDVAGGSGPGGVVITVVEWQGRRTVHASGPADPCHYTLEPGPPGFAPDPATVPPRPPDSYLAVLACDGVAVDLVWVGPHNTVDLGAEAERLARRWVGRVPVPEVAVRSSPPQRGLAGLATWLWLEGADRRDRRATLRAFGVPVHVRMPAGPVSWDFGDGAGHVGGAGRPGAPDVRHVFTRASVDRGGPYRITASYSLEPAYRIDGEAWVALPPIVVRAHLDHPVGEAQAVLGGGDAP